MATLFDSKLVQRPFRIREQAAEALTKLSRINQRSTNEQMVTIVLEWAHFKNLERERRIGDFVKMQEVATRANEDDRVILDEILLSFKKEIDKQIEIKELLEEIMFSLQD